MRYKVSIKNPSKIPILNNFDYNITKLRRGKSKNIAIVSDFINSINFIKQWNFFIKKLETYIESISSNKKYTIKVKTSYKLVRIDAMTSIIQIGKRTKNKTRTKKHMTFVYQTIMNEIENVLTRDVRNVEWNTFAQWTRYFYGSIPFFVVNISNITNRRVFVCFQLFRYELSVDNSIKMNL